MDTEPHPPEPRERACAEALLAHVRSGDREAFTELVRSYQPYAYALAMRFVWDHADAEDIVQESFIRVWRHCGAFHEGSKFTTWLYAIVTHVSMDRLRKKKRWGSLVIRSGEPEEEGGFAGAGEVVDELHMALTVDRVRSMASRLPEAQRIVFTLRDLQDLSVEEVRQITGMSAELIKAHLYHARKRIRSLMREQGINDGR